MPVHLLLGCKKTENCLPTLPTKLSCISFLFRACITCKKYISQSPEILGTHAVWIVSFPVQDGSKPKLSCSQFIFIDWISKFVSNYQYFSLKCFCRSYVLVGFLIQWSTDVLAFLNNFNFFLSPFFKTILILGRLSNKPMIWRFDPKCYVPTMKCQFH